MVNILQKGDLKAADFSNNNTNNSQGIGVKTDPASAVGQAISAAVSSLPSDKYLQGLQAYNAATNTLTLLLNDNSTVSVNLSGLLTDATAEITNGKVSVFGNDGTTLLGYLLPV